MKNIKIYDKRAIISYDTGSICNFSCSYCYNWERLMIPQITDLSESEDYLNSNSGSFDIITPGCEQELFVNPAKAIEFLEYFSDFGKILSFSTKESFNQDMIENLVEIDRRLKTNNQYLLAEISFISGYDTPSIEKKISSIDSRIDTLESLMKNGINAVPFIRPILPDKIIETKDILHLVDRTKDFCECYVIGDFYFNDVIADKLNLHSLDDSFWDSVHEDVSADFFNTENNMTWYKYVDEKKKEDIKNYIESHSRYCYDSSTEAILHFKNK